MKNISIIVLLLLFSNSSFADVCGEGKVTHLLEGAWNTDDYFMKIDYSVSPSKHPGTEFNGYIVYRKADMSTERLKGIKAVALSALLVNKTVKTYSHNNDCDRATQIQITP